MEHNAKRRKTELVESSGPGDPETEFILENELREEHEQYWYEGVFTRQDHLPPSQDSLNAPEDVDMDDDSLDSWLSWTSSPDPWIYHDLHDEEVHLSRVGAEGITEAEEWEDLCRDLEILKEREMEEWPEVMPKQYDETPEEAHKRQLILQIVRDFLRE